MFELPIPEDIYDYDSFGLKDVLDKITSGLQELGERPDYPKETQSWIKKAKKLHGMISLELEERRAVEEFEDFCQKGEDYLKKMESNPYSSKPPEPQLRDSTEMISMKTRSPTKIEASQVSTASDSSMSRAQVESSAASQEGQSEYGDSRHSVMSDEYGSQLYSRMHHAKKKKTAKKNNMFEFMKATLEATRITNNTMSIGKSSVADVPSRHPHQAEENKEMIRRDKPSVSESNRPPLPQKKVFAAARPIQRPDPGFNPADTRTGSFMELGGGPKVEMKMKPQKAKKKSPSVSDVGEEEKYTRSKSMKKKEEKEKEKEAPVSLKVKKDKSKEEKGESKEVKEVKSTKPAAATLTKSKTMEEKASTEKKKDKAEVKPETKASAVVEQKKNTVPVKETKTVVEESNKKVNGVKPAKNVEDKDKDNKSVSSKPGSQNLIDIEEEDEERENKEEEEEVKVQKEKAVPQSNLKINEPATTFKDSAIKSPTRVDIKQESKAEVEQKAYAETKGGDSKLNQIEEVKQQVETNKPQVSKPKIQDQEDYEEETMKKFEIKTPQPSESPQTPASNQAIVESQPKAQPSTTESTNKPAFRIRMHGALKETEKPVEEQEKARAGSQSNQGDSESEHDKESAKGEAEEQSASEESVKGETTPSSSAEKASIAEKYEFKDKIDVGKVGLKQSKITYQSPNRDAAELRESPYETKKSELYTENTRASSNSSFRAKAELSGEFEGPRPLQERALESRSSMGSSQNFNDSSVSKSGTKASSLPQIETKSTGRKSKESSPTLPKQKTSLPPIEGNRIMMVDDIIKSHMSEVAAAKTKQSSKVNEVSSPTQAGRKIGSNPTSSAGSSRPQQKEVERSAAAQKQAERRNQAEERREAAQARMKPMNTTKPAAGKTGKAGDFPPVSEEDVVDYSYFFQSFQELFSGAWINPNGFDYLMVMRDLFNMFTVHARSVDNMDTMLAKYKPSIAPLELGPNDLIAQNNMNHIFMYATKTNIDLRMYLERQQIFHKNVSLLQHGEDPDDKPDPATESRNLYYRVVKTKSEVYDIVTRSFLRKRNWVELPHGMNLKTTWNLLWTWGKPQIDMNKLLVFQKVNHFPGNKGIVRKDLLKANIERIQKLGQKAAAAFNIIPATFVLPKEITKFIEVFYEHHEKEGPYNIWIVKPVGKSRGRGISLMNDLGALKYTETIVAQKYMKNPLLLNGFKFDMRIYVLVTSVDPIEAFIYKEGFARISTVPFSTDIADLDNLFIHLTNSSVQKNSGVIDHTSSDAIVGGTKISLKTLRQRLERKSIAWDPIWSQICEIVVKSLYACQNEVNHHPNAFELFGYDIMIDSDLKCWLIEVNSSPSLERMNILDDLVKQQLVDDTIDLVAPVDFDRARLVQVLERRILEEQRCKSSINTSNNSRAQLNKDITYILHGKKLREPGEMPAFLGNYERIAPTEMSDRIQRLIQSYKVQYKTPMQQDKK